MKQKSSTWYLRFGTVLLLAVAVSGCPRKPSPAPELGPDTSGSPGLGTGDMGAGDTTRDRLGGMGEGGPLRDVTFGYDSFDLSSEARDTLRANADWIQGNSQSKVEIEGHCDDRGTVEYNLALGAKRAKSARDYLTSLGVSSDRLSTISYGEELPLCSEASESCWAQNRRAHFLVVNR